MKYKELNSKHSSYDADLARRYQMLYQGGNVFRKNIACFLPRNRQEQDEVYQMRCHQAPYISHVGSIIDQYGATIFSAPYTIRAHKNQEEVLKLDDFYSEFKEDVDTSGTDLSTFFKSRFQEALVKKNAYWLVESPTAPSEIEEITELNRNEWIELGLDRLRLKAVPTENLFDWECDCRGELEWAVLFSDSCTRPAPGSETLYVKTWKIYTREEVIVYELQHTASKPPQEEQEIPLVEKYKHNLPGVPLLALCLPEGMWLMDRASDAQLEHFRLSAAQAWVFRRAAYPMGVFHLTDSDSLPQTGAGQALIMGKEEDFEWKEPGGASFAAFENRIKAAEQTIYKVTVQMALSTDPSGAALGRSAESKQADMSSADTCLRAFAVFIKEAIEKTYEFISNARGEYELKFSIEDLNSFSLIDITTLVTNATSAKALNIQSETFWKELYKRIAIGQLPPDTKQDIKELIRQEIDQSEIETKIEPDEQMGDKKEQFGSKDSPDEEVNGPPSSKSKDQMQK